MERLGEGVRDGLHAISEGVEIRGGDGHVGCLQPDGESLTLPAPRAHHGETVRAPGPGQAVKGLPQFRHRGALARREAREEASQFVDPLRGVGQILAPQLAQLLRQFVV